MSRTSNTFCTTAPTLILHSQYDISEFDFIVYSTILESLTIFISHLSDIFNPNSKSTTLWPQSKEQRAIWAYIHRICKLFSAQPPEICWQKLVSTFSKSPYWSASGNKQPKHQAKIMATSISPWPISDLTPETSHPQSPRGSESRRRWEWKGDFKSAIAVKYLLGIQIPLRAFFLLFR